MGQNNKPQKVVFRNEEFQRPNPSLQTPTPKMLSWVMKYSGGYINDERQASYVLIVFLVLATIISIFLFSNSSPKVSNEIIISPLESVGSQQGLPQ